MYYFVICERRHMLSVKLGHMSNIQDASCENGNTCIHLENLNIKRFEDERSEDEKKLFKYVSSANVNKTSETLEMLKESQESLNNLWNKKDEKQLTLIQYAIMANSEKIINIFLNYIECDSASSNWYQVLYEALEQAYMKGQFTIANTIAKNIEDKLNGETKREFLLDFLTLAINADDITTCYNLIYKERIMLPDMLQDKAKKKKTELEFVRTTLQQSQKHFQAYRAYANPKYILLTEEDPLLAALKRSERFNEMGNHLLEFKQEFEKLSKNTSKFAVELLTLCDEENHLDTLLTPTCSSCAYNSTEYGRLRRIISLKQKQFITAPICQKKLKSLWLGQLQDSWPNWSIKRAVWHVAKHVMLAPFLCLLYTIGCSSRITASCKIPLNRFVYSATLYCAFLAYMGYTTYYKGSSDGEYTKRFHWSNGIFIFWFFAFMFKAISDIHMELFRKHCDKCKTKTMLQWWTIYELIMVILFFMFCICYITARIDNVKENSPIISSSLAMVAEGFFSILITLAFVRVLEWFHLSATFGHIIISFSRMTDVLLKLLIIYGIVLFGFSAGIYTVYKDYHPKNVTGGVFMKYDTTLKTLFWALFGQNDPKYADIPYDNPTNFANADRKFSAIIGYILWGVYHISFVIILLNMLIAIMTNSYQVIQDNSDMEWKFARTKVWIYYFEDQNAVPPPFNLLRAIRCGILYIMEHIGLKQCMQETNATNDADRVGKEANNLEATYKKLTQRYMIKKIFKETKKN